ncbi:MAG TPA: tetratricopeptide repeat protein [Thermodesulfovibrionia bacterium]|nr:tetratricopeptide repeat protein [Thermodesulfovibrionia bacterium]
MTKPTVFISYSHKDEQWKDRLTSQLNVLAGEGILDTWADRRIETGEDWYQEIEQSINRASAVVMLISADFLNSKFIKTEEVPRFLEKRQNEGVKIFPLIVRPCPWQKVKWLAPIQARPKDGKPLSKMKKADREEALSAFAVEVSDIINVHAKGGNKEPDDELQQGFKLADNMPTVVNWVGRADELRDLKAKIFNPDTRAIEITGTAAFGVIGSPGIGKTTLASKLINDLHDEQAPFAASAWASMRPNLGTNKPPSFHAVTDSILFVLSNGKITTATTARDDFHKKTERILSILNEKPCLIVFDNVESVLRTEKSYYAGYFEPEFKDYAHLFKSLVEIKHQSKIIFTSRESLVELSKLVYKPVKLEGLKTEDALELLKKFKLKATDAELKQLSDCYQGHPKALLLVASLIEESYRGQASLFLHSQTCTLTGDIDHLLDEVFTRMSLEELECLSRISIYQTDRYPLDIKGISVQMPEIDNYEIEHYIVRALERRQLLDYDIKRNTYYLHPFVQEKANRQLKNNAEHHKTAHEIAYNHFIKILLKSESEWKGVDDVMPRIMAHHHACQLGKWDDAAQAVEAFRYKYLNQWSEPRLMLELLLPLIPDDWKDGNRKLTSEQIHGDILNNIGIGYYNLSNFKKAKEFYMLALTTAINANEALLESNVLNNLGHVFSDLGEYQKAIDYYHQSLDITRKIGDRLDESKALNNLGSVFSDLGEYQKAIDYYHQALDITRKIGDKIGEGIALDNLCGAYGSMGNQTKAMECCSKGLLISREIGDKNTEGYLLNDKGIIHQRLGNYTDAIRCCEQALQIAQEIGEKGLEGSVLCRLGITLGKQQKYSEALDKLGQAQKIGHKIGDKRTEGGAYYALAEVYREMGERELQEEYRSKAVKIAEELGIRVELLADV